MVAKKKKKTRSTASTGHNGEPGLTIQRGGEQFTLEKATDLMAVRKRPRTAHGALDAAAAKPQTFSGLEFLSAASWKDFELYRLDASTLNEAMDLVRESSRDVVWCAHVYHMPGDSSGWMVPTDTIYVELADETDDAALNALLDEYGLEVTPMEEGQPGMLLLRLTSASTKNPIKIANALLASGAVKVAEPDFAERIDLKAYRPTDTLFPQQWHLENLGGYGLTAGADVSAPGAWEITRGDRSIVVCVIDDGVQTDHPDFSSVGKIVAPFDFGESDADPSPVSPDDNHGTSCAGVAVADENGAGVVGMAPNCRMMPIRTSGWITDQTIESRFRHARENGADVISCSWGVQADFFSLSTRKLNAIQRAAQDGRNGRGCVIVFAAGNENRPVDGIKNGVHYRAGFAIHPDVIAVAASNSRDYRSHYSNYGKQISVCAPSSGAGGLGIVTTDRTGTAGYQAGDYTTIERFGGTSSSTPLVAGVAALILSVNSELTSTEVNEILQETADRIDTANGAYDAKGHSEIYGYGRVNALRAVQEAQRRANPSPVRTVAFERTLSLAIPDLHPAGVSDSITVGESATLRTIEVAVDITHTYRGDLQVKLTGPDSTTVLLHDKSGGTHDNLVRTYRMADVPGLAAFVAKAAGGIWTLHVADYAFADTGVLNHWSLVLGLDGGPPTEWETSPGLIIPDNDALGITSDLLVDGHGKAKAIELMVDINHTYRGDLRVTLESPDGLTALVHEMAGGDTDNLQRTFTNVDTSGLQNLVDAGVGLNGTWRLHVADRLPSDIGKLNSWKLKLLT